jgi:hypothetical protein
MTLAHYSFEELTPNGRVTTEQLHPNYLLHHSAKNQRKQSAGRKSETPYRTVATIH